MNPGNTGALLGCGEQQSLPFDPFHIFCLAGRQRERALPASSWRAWRTKGAWPGRFTTSVKSAWRFALIQWAWDCAWFLWTRKATSAVESRATVPSWWLWLHLERTS
ncbi:uncharacterized protein CIMG_06501 [Coccidioides immitis RS]|uniref:Uncharacterized protein n=1 Tax=Coccidioides immitis (strain RS) TaxID=246410 RepID=A0A0D8JTB0_COCIM|nr:uncharacterized protein CIMG_06501 [Coccidioides immitis RS]KJF60590.1 hypothetical protein CIMG_06501 [Coccidioides immitis RS]